MSSTTQKHPARAPLVLEGLVALALLALLALAVKLFLFESPLVWVDLIADDAYYYMGVARQMALGAGSSYLPPFETNGYQPLWMLLTSGLAMVFGTGDRSMAVQIYTLSISFVALFAWASRRSYGAGFPAILVAALIPPVMLAGMETVMMPLLFIGLMRSRHWAVEGVLATLIFLTRLDALALVGAKHLVELVADRRINWRPYLVIVPAVAAYLGINQALFGTPLPVSGLAKAVGNVRGENIGAVTGYITYLRTAGVLLVLLAMYLLVTRQRPALRYGRELAILAVTLPVCAAYYGINSGWPLWPWYYWPSLLITFYIIQEIWGHFHAEGRVRAAQGVTGLLGVALLALALVHAARPLARQLESTWSVYQWRNLSPAALPPSFGRKNVELATVVKQGGLKPDAFFAMGDRAGSFGFFVGDQIRFLHTEGLVASMAYGKALQQDRGLDFYKAQAVDYLVADRGQFLRAPGVIGVIEPVQGLSSPRGPWLVCQPEHSIVLDQSYGNQQRFVFDARQRIDCPKEMTARFLQMRSTYGRINKFSGTSAPAP